MKFYTFMILLRKIYNKYINMIYFNLLVFEKINNSILKKR